MASSPASRRGEDVEVGAARAVDGHEVLGREDRSDHPPQGPRGVPEEAVEHLPAVGLLDVAVLLDVDVEDAHVAVVEETVPQRVDDDGHRGELGDGVEEKVLKADLLVLVERNAGRGSRFSSSSRRTVESSFLRVKGLVM